MVESSVRPGSSLLLSNGMHVTVVKVTGKDVLVDVQQYGKSLGRFAMRYKDVEAALEGDDSPAPPNHGHLQPVPATQMVSSPAFMPNLVAAIAASIGVLVGTFGPWVTLVAIPVNGVDINLASGWGGTLTLGGSSALVLFTQLVAARSGRTSSWLVPLMCAVPVCGLLSFIVTLIYITRVRSATSEFLGVALGLQAGWGLWIACTASAALCVTAWVVALKMTDSVESEGKATRSTWAGLWSLAAMLSCVALVGYTFWSWGDITKQESTNFLNLPAKASPSPGSSAEGSSATSSAPETDRPGTAANGALEKQMGQLAAFTSPEGTILDFVVTDISRNTCTTQAPELPQNGTFLVIDITATTHDDPTVLKWGGTFGTFSPSNWQVVGPPGITDPNVETFNGFACSDQLPPSSFALNSQYEFQVVLDSKFSSGAVVFRPGDTLGWTWNIPG